MTFVVAEPCIKCKFTECVQLCPVDCFHEGPNFLVIDPVACIDCNACAPACPADAIFSDKQLPEKYSEYLEINARLAPEWPVIYATKSPLPDAQDWLAVSDKREHLIG